MICLVGVEAFVPLEDVAVLVEGSICALGIGIGTDIGKVILSGYEGGGTGDGVGAVGADVVGTVGRRGVWRFGGGGGVALGGVFPVAGVGAAGLVVGGFVPFVFGGEEDLGIGVARDGGGVGGGGGSAEKGVSAGFGVAVALAVVEPVDEAKGVVEGGVGDGFIVLAGDDGVFVAGRGGGGKKDASGVLAGAHGGSVEAEGVGAGRVFSV